jgi:hypothetical protein
MCIKNIRVFTLAAIIIFTLGVTPESFAKTYQWDDFTKPFIQELTVGSVDVGVRLPQILIQQYKEVIVVIRQSGLKGSYGGIIRGGSLKINDQSVWSMYKFGLGERPKRNIRIKIKTKHLRAGRNIFHLSTFTHGIGQASYPYTIYSIRFELPDGKNIFALRTEKPSPKKIEKKQFVKPAKKAPKDTTPPEIIILSHDTSRAINVLRNDKKVTIKGKATDKNGIVEILANNKDAAFDKFGNFEVDVYLGLGDNEIVVSAMDPYENRAFKKFIVTREAPAVSMKKEVSKAPAPKFYALVIGNNDYRYLRDLVTAKNDARVVNDILQHKFGFSTKLLLDAKRNDILDAINSYRKIVNEDDSFLIYYAGHGEFDRSADKAYWLPIDARSDNDTNWIIVDTITSNIKRMSSNHILVVSDSCYSGTFTRRGVTDLESAQKRSRYLQKMGAKKSRTLLASGGNEPVSDIGGGGHSIFAKAFVSGLKSMGPAVFTAEELYYQHIKEMVAGGSDQTPEYNIIRNSGHEGGDFLFIKSD